MEKVILFEPTLLAEVERESPAVYKEFCTTPFANIDFADYGTSEIHMYMPRYILHMFKVTTGQDSGKMLMETLQSGWVFGNLDLFLKNEGSLKNPLEKELAMVRMMMAGIAYPYYNLETLIKDDNFRKRNHIIYNTITYQESQCFNAWKVILMCHQEFNDRFVELKAEAKNVTIPEFQYLDPNKPKFKPGLPLDENDPPVDFNSYRGSNKNCG